MANRASVRIALLSAVMLFLEMLLVRWIGTEVRIFAYLQNAVLVAAFLGLGLGCLDSARPASLRTAALCLVGIGLFVRDPFDWQLSEAVTQGLTAFQGSTVWGADRQAAVGYERIPLITFAVGVTLGLLAAVAAALRPLGQWLGRWLDAHPRPVAAYTANILGSLVGIAAFDLLTVAATPPWIWLAVASLGLLPFLRLGESGPYARAVALGALIALPALGLAPRGSVILWSPYQKLSLSPLEVQSPRGTATCGTLIKVNNAGFQIMVELRHDRLAARPDLYPEAEVPYSHYRLPYLLIGPRTRALVVGSGAGNDVAAALEAGVQQVQAVEIDPAIVALGRARHPDGPYASSRVSVAVDDARAFFHRPSGPYDLVWFGLLDSHTAPSAYANVRLDHFVYTRESFLEMKRLLAPDGVVVLLFQPQTTWIADRLHEMFRDTFGAAPLVFQVRSSTPCLGWGGLLYVGGSPATTDALRRRTQSDPQLADRQVPREVFTSKTEVTTDDWPYLYLPGRGVPPFYLLVGGAALVLAWIIRRGRLGAREPVDHPMLLLGAGFMLLEVTAVSRAALLYGTTWKVNAYVVGAILSMVLLANLTAAWRRPAVTSWPFPGLVLAILAVALVPTAWLAALPPLARVVLGGAFLALPVFFSGVVFVQVWAAEPRRGAALGSNLIGSLLGGIASMLSMVIGFQALAFLNLLVYLAAWLLLRDRPPLASGTETASP